MPDFSFNDEFTPYKPGFASVDWNFNADPTGQLYRPSPINQPPQAKSVESLAAELLQKQRAQAEAVRLQHKIDNIYERAMNEAPRRDIEVLPPETPAEALDPTRTRMRNVTPIDERQEIGNLLENQIKRPQRPSTAVPPGNTNTSGARVTPLVDIQAPPIPASPRTPLAAPASAIEIKPKSLPVPAGRVVMPVAGALVDFGLKITFGQSAQQAALGTAGSVAGGIAGAAIGSSVGPIGTFIGGLIGGLAGQAIADFVWNQIKPKVAEPPQLEPGFYPFYGGQLPVLYRIKVCFPAYGNRCNSEVNPVLQGPISSFTYVPDPDGFWLIYISYGAGKIYFNADGMSNPRINPNGEPHIVSVVRNDGLPDNGGNIKPYFLSDKRTPTSVGHPGNQSFTVPSGIPKAGSNAPPSNYAPGGLASGNNEKNTLNWVPRAYPAPKNNPNPDTSPTKLVNGLPDIAPNFNTSPDPNLNPYLPSTNNKNNPNPSAENPPASRLYGPPNQLISSGPPTVQDKLPPAPSRLPTPSNNPTPLILPPKTFEPPPQPQPQPQPQPETQPPVTNPPTTTTDICEEPCIVTIVEKITIIERLIEENCGGEKTECEKFLWLDVRVPTVFCTKINGVWRPERKYIAVKVFATEDGSQILQTLLQFEEMAKQAEQSCFMRQKLEDIELKICQVAANNVNTMRSVVAGVANINEYIAESLGKVANALKRYGVVGSAAYPWFPEQIDSNIEVIERVESQQMSADALALVNSEVQTVSQLANELETQDENFANSLLTITPKDREDNNPVKNKADASTINSIGPEINDEDKEADE